MWFYRNEGGQGILDQLTEKLEGLGHEVFSAFDMRRCRARSGRVLTEEGVDLTGFDLLYFMNADEQSAHQRDILQTLELSGLRLINRFAAFDRAQDKFVANTLLRRHGVRVPDAALLPLHPGRACVRELMDVWGRAVVKLRRGHGGRGVQRFDDADRLWDYCQATSELVDGFYCERFVPFGDADIRVDLIDGELVGGYARRRGHYFKTNVHAGATMLPVPPEAEAVALARRAATVLDVTCTIVDVVRAEADGALHVLEVNPQLGVFAEAGLRTGVNTVQSEADIHPVFAYDARKVAMLAAALDRALRAVPGSAGT